MELSPNIQLFSFYSTYACYVLIEYRSFGCDLLVLLNPRFHDVLTLHRHIQYPNPTSDQNSKKTVLPSIVSS